MGEKWAIWMLLNPFRKAFVIFGRMKTITPLVQ